jgi:DNA invertase Pin-like site-specific DNA recombinase
MEKSNLSLERPSDKRQRAAIEAYAKRAGFALVAEYYDKAVSGADRATLLAFSN